jgi:AbrB family looped-hinge helix DNA binding protein
MRRFVGNVSTKGQVTLPSELRVKLGIKPGDQVVMSETDEGIIVRTRKKLTLKDIYGSIPPLNPPRSLAEIKEMATEEAAREHLHLDRYTR